MKVLLQWNGTNDTRIRTEQNGEKIEMKVGRVLEVDEKQAQLYVYQDKNFKIVGKNEEKELEQPKPPTPKRDIPNKRKEWKK